MSEQYLDVINDIQAPEGRRRKNGDPDLRCVPKAERPTPTSGQSSPPKEIPWKELGAGGKKIVKTFNGSGNGVRDVLNIEEVHQATGLTKLEIRNTLRKLVQGQWVEKVPEIITDIGEIKAVKGYYRVTEDGRAKIPGQVQESA